MDTFNGNVKEVLGYLVRCDVNKITECLNVTVHFETKTFSISAENGIGTDTEEQVKFIHAWTRRKGEREWTSPGICCWDANSGGTWRDKIRNSCQPCDHDHHRRVRQLIADV